MKLRSAAIKLYSSLFGRCTRLVSDRSYVRTLYFLSFGKRPALDHPKTFSEHICAIKLSDESLGFSAYTDKYAVRDYVEKTIGKDLLTPMLGVYQSFDEIPFDSFPNQFALKATHASGYNLIVRDKDSLDLTEGRRKFCKWLSKNYYTVGREKNYKNVPPQILAEQYVSFAEPLTEYKLFCFGGKVRLIGVNRFYSDRHTVTVYTPAWERLDVTMGYPAEKECDRPENLEELLSCAEKLSAPFRFVRVDLYSDGSSVRFSELTFTPGGGLVHILPERFNQTMGSWFDEL